MRKDMFKVIVERPRYGWRWGGNHGDARMKRNFGDGSVPMTGARAHKLAGYSRALNENLNPLKRYLGRQVGRPWDKVYSEICENLDTGSAVKQHVRDHLEDLVALKLTVRSDGSLHCYARHGFYKKWPWYQAFFVDPRNGVLRDSDRYFRSRGIERRPRRKALSKPDDRVIVSDDVQLRRVDGIWYEIVLGHVVTANDDCRPVMDVECACSQQRRRPYLKCSHQREILKKRQLSRKDLKTHGLENIQELRESR